MSTAGRPIKKDRPGAVLRFGLLVLHMGERVFNALDHKLVAGYIDLRRLAVDHFQQTDRNAKGNDLFLILFGHKFFHRAQSSLLNCTRSGIIKLYYKINISFTHTKQAYKSNMQPQEEMSCGK